MGLLRGWCRLGYGILQAWQPHGLGLQVSPGLGDEVPLRGAWRRRWKPVPGVAARDGARARDGCACRLDQPRPCAYAGVDPAAAVGVARGAAPEGAQLAQA